MIFNYQEFLFIHIIMIGLRPGRLGCANVDSFVDPADIPLGKGFEDFYREFMALLDSVFRPGRKWHLDTRLGKGLQ